MRGYSVCADDAHGAPIMIAAEKAGSDAASSLAGIAAGRKPYLDGFHIGFDNWHSTDGAGEPRSWRRPSTARCAANGLIATRTIEQFFDRPKGMFLADRFIKGECPKCGAKDQVRRQLRGLRRGVRAHRAEAPVSRRCRGAAPELRTSDALLLPACPTRAGAGLPAASGRRTPASCRPEVLNKISEWFGDRRGAARPGLADWDISRDAPYFGIEIPDAPGKYFYVWLERPGGLPRLAAERCSARHFEAYVADPAVEQVHFIGKDIVTFHTLFWPAMLHFSGRKTPAHIFVHGYLTVNNEKMSKSRGTGISPAEVPRARAGRRSGCATTSPPSSTPAWRTWTSTPTISSRA
jgi:methionyl-tRNA synthetase